MDNPVNLHQEILHVGQISLYLAFNKSLCKGKHLDNLTGVPSGYNNFATTFNDGTHPHDYRHLSTIVSTPTDQIVRSTRPVILRDFVITAEQCGTAVVHHSITTKAQASVFKEYTTTMALWNKRHHKAYQDRDDKCARNAAIASCRPKRQNRQQLDQSITNLDDEDSTYTIGSFDGLSQTSTNEAPIHQQNLKVGTLKYLAV